jgi:hypothetical protein
MNCWYCGASAIETYEVHAGDGSSREVPVLWGEPEQACDPHSCTDRKPMPEDLWGAGLAASARIIDNLASGRAGEERSR